MNFLSDTCHLFIRHVRATLRMPVFLIISIVQPILWMLLFGQLFRAVTTLPGFGSESFVQFLAPGIVIMSAIFGSAYSGMGILNDIDRGVMDRMLATPASRLALIAARIVHAGVTVMLQAGIILVIAFLLGARPRNGVVSIVLVLLAASLAGASFAGISNGVAILTRRAETLMALMNFTVLPMTFLSSMIMSKALMPGWIHSVTFYNPVDWAVTMSRGGFEGLGAGAVVTPCLLLIALSVICGTLATRAFRVYRRTL